MIRCDFCKKKAVYNISEAWHLYSINEKDEYNELDSWEGSENNHYCEKCYDKQTGGYGLDEKGGVEK